MRTKHFLTALCLPLAFAACTNDDFVLESNTLEGRGKIDVVLTAEKPAFGADTKMSIDDKNQFLWEKDADMIGAALVNGANATQVGNDIYVNYPFTADADGNVSTFSGKSSMTEGKYFFYYEYQDVLNRKALPMGKPAQVYDAANTEKTALQQAAAYMRMVSPIINLAKGLKYADAQTYNLNLKFANLYTIVRVDIKSGNIPEGVAPKVTKIKLDGKINNASAFKTDAAIDMTKVKDAGVIGLDDEGQIKAGEQTAALAKLEEMIASGAIYSDNQADGTTAATKGAFDLEVKGDVVLNATETTSLYILVPKGTYKQLDLTVETSEGSYERTVTSSSDIVLANSIQPVTANLNFAQDGTGNVILPTNFEIASTDDWKAAIKFMTEHAVGYLNKTAKFTLTKDVEIENLPIFNLTINAASDEEKVLTLKKDYTISEDNKGQFTFTSVKLAVANGAALTLKAQPENIETDIINYGTLNVGASLENAIENFGVMNVTADATLEGGLTNGQLENKATKTPEYVGEVNVAKGKTLAVKTKALSNVNGTVTVAEDAVLNIKVISENKEDGEIVVKGTLTTGEDAEKATLTNEGTVDNFGSVKLAITNSGLVVVEKESTAKADASEITGGVVEVKDVATFSKLQQSKDRADVQYNFGENTKVTTKVTNAGGYRAADAENVGITDITLTNGEWTLASDAGADASKTVAVPVSATGLTLEGATLNINIDELTADISTSGTATSTIKVGRDKTSVTVKGNVNVGTGSTLAVENGVQVNELKQSNDKIANVNGVLNVMPGAKMYFNKATVGVGSSLNVKGNTNNADAAEFGVQVVNEFINSGIVTSEAGTHTTSTSRVAGKVSNANNTGSGHIVGNSETFTWGN